jgi:hypothetical protein
VMKTAPSHFRDWASTVQWSLTNPVSCSLVPGGYLLGLQKAVVSTGKMQARKIRNATLPGLIPIPLMAMNH